MRRGRERGSGVRGRLPKLHHPGGPLCHGVGQLQGKVGLDLGRAARSLSPEVVCKTGMPRDVAGALHQAGRPIPHINLGRYHAITNRYNWYKPWKWFVR